MDTIDITFGNVFCHRRLKIILFNNCMLSNLNYSKSPIKKKIKLITESYKVYLIKQYSSNFSPLIMDIILSYYTSIYHIIDMGRKIEMGCYNKAKSQAIENNINISWHNPMFISIYHMICYEISINLDKTSVINSNILHNKLINNEVDPYQLAFIIAKDNFSKNRVIEDKINKRLNINITLKYSELYKCRKCKKNQTTLERRYNRSLDEGVNLTVTCDFCGFQWNG